eukprot:47704-Chlamydomonas_euryale.AAC.1
MSWGLRDTERVMCFRGWGRGTLSKWCVSGGRGRDTERLALAGSRARQAGCKGFWRGKDSYSRTCPSTRWGGPGMLRRP